MNVLSIKQMQYLRSLGLDTTDASMVMIFTDEEDNILDWDDISYECSEFGDAYAPFYKDDDGKLKQAYESLLDAKTGNYDHSYRESCGVFDLNDLLDLLPPIIDLYVNKENYLLSLTLQYDDKGNWVCFYQMNARDTIEEGYGVGMFMSNFSDSKIEAAYNLLVECSEKGVLKSGKLIIELYE